MIVKYKRRRRISDSSEGPRVLSKRQAISSVSSNPPSEYGFNAFRGIYGNNAMLRKAQAQMQADMDQISAGDKSDKQPS